MATEVRPKGRKHIGGGVSPVYEKHQIHSPNGAVEIEESLWLVRLRFLEHILSMEIIINFFHPFGAKFVLFFYSGALPPAIC